MRRTPERNYDNIQYSELRKGVEEPWNVLHDSLEKAYYDYWKQGLPYSWGPYNVCATPEESKKQFDILHSLIFHHLLTALHTECKQRKAGKRDGKYYESLLTDYSTTTEQKPKSRIDTSKQSISEAKEKGFIIKLSFDKE